MAEGRQWKRRIRYGRVGGAKQVGDGTCDAEAFPQCHYPNLSLERIGV